MTASEAVFEACRRLGVDNAVQRAYWRARIAATGGRYRAHAAGVDATFAIATRDEFLRATTFLGENAMLEAFIDDLDGDETVWDVGANVGLYACFAARALDDGVVVGVEPEPENAARLRENLTRNAPADRWRVADIALWDRDEPLSFTSERRGLGAGHHYVAPWGDRSVLGRRGDTLVGAGYPTPEVLKIDVQGAELHALRGLGDCLDDVERIYAEIHTEKTARYGTTVAAVEEFLVDAGFDPDPLGEPEWNRSGVYHIRAGRT